MLSCSAGVGSIRRSCSWSAAISSGVKGLAAAGALTGGAGTMAAAGWAGAGRAAAAGGGAMVFRMRWMFGARRRAGHAPQGWTRLPLDLQPARPVAGAVADADEAGT